MIRAEQIPPEVVEAAARANCQGYDDFNDITRQFVHELTRASIAAALSAWPGVTTTSWFENGTRKAVLNIPLPLEVSDE